MKAALVSRGRCVMPKYWRYVNVVVYSIRSEYPERNEADLGNVGHSLPGPSQNLAFGRNALAVVEKYSVQRLSARAWGCLPSRRTKLRLAKLKTLFSKLAYKYVGVCSLAVH